MGGLTQGEGSILAIQRQGGEVQKGEIPASSIPLYISMAY